MKRIINGVAYNTETSTKVARSEYDNTSQGGPRGEQVLYQTRGGAFFLHTFEVSAHKDRDGEWQERESNDFEVMLRDEAQQWVMNAGQVELLGNVFGDPPEAAADESAVPNATIYARVPLALKSQVEASAKAAGLSVNSFLIRCMETCAATARASDAPAQNRLTGMPNNLAAVSRGPVVSMQNDLARIAAGSAVAPASRNALLEGLGDAPIPTPPRNRLLGD